MSDNIYNGMKFNDEQMVQIRRGLEKGLNVSIYAKPEFNGEQMFQIREGLKEGFDVSIYAKPEFDYREMYELRTSKRAIRKLQNRCPHNDPQRSVGVLQSIADENNPNVINVIKTLKCELCHKDDIVDPPDLDTLREAMDVINDAMSHVKIKLNTSVPAESVLCEEVGKYLNSGDHILAELKKKIKYFENL